jgi:mannonate dehydratase
MRQTWRWFGPDDPVTTEDMLQAGVEGVVSALHHVPIGAVWTASEIARRQAEIARRPDGSPSGLAWEVVESLPVSEDVKKQSGDWRAHLANYRESLANLAAAGIGVVCYNFMPVLDWTRTDIAYRLPHGGTCLRFDLADFAAFDLHILERPGAADDCPAALRDEAARRFAAMDENRRRQLARTVAAGLPGTDSRLTLDGLRAHLADYRGISAETLRSHFIAFLESVVPTAESLGLRLCCHPDDPPFALLGLPRIVSTEADYAAILAAVDSPANGVTLCSGSLGSRPDNDLPGMMRRLGPRVHFLHLRNVRRESPDVPGSFHEAEHLGGGTDMVALIAEVVAEERRRAAAGRADASIPFRPDHGHQLLDDLRRPSRPGYPAIGRLRGLAELRGVIAALTHPAHGLPA